MIAEMMFGDLLEQKNRFGFSVVYIIKRLSLSIRIVSNMHVLCRLLVLYLWVFPSIIMEYNAVMCPV